MKRILTLLLMLVMLLTLVGCKADEQIEEPTIKEQEIQEPPTKEEPVQEEQPTLGTWTAAEDSTITDELKDIFNQALKGLLGASYEPKELIATQVVNGINYKILAEGSKTTNPITKGTYYVTVNKSATGEISLVNIETIEETQEEVKKTVSNLDITNMLFWIVTFDQYGNEVDRYTAKYGSTVYDPNTGKAITVKGNTRFYVTKDYSTASSEEPSPMPSPTPEPTPTPEEPNYLYFKNIGSTDTTFQLGSNGSPSISIAFQYSKDKTNWVDLPADIDIDVLVGETVYFKAKTSNPYMYDSTGNNGYHFNSNASNSDSLEVGGSIMTLLDPTDVLRDISGKDHCFYYLFRSFDNLKKADNLVCPATTLSPYCYYGLFYECYYLVSINPDLLPATDLTDCDYCYYGMFYDCESLTNVPNLPATTLSKWCYGEMFHYCYALETVPTNLLPATDLTDCDYCYYCMFYDCEGLTNVPNLPATTLSKWCYDEMFCYCYALENVPENLLPTTDLTGYDSCYRYMFSHCKNLIKAPILPADTLSPSCYCRMFYGCLDLNSVEVGFTSFNSLINSETEDWLYNVADIGTFKWQGGTSVTLGSSTIPNSWAIIY